MSGKTSRADRHVATTRSGSPRVVTHNRRDTPQATGVEPVAFGERDPMSEAASLAAVPLCRSTSSFYGKLRRCTRAAGHDSGGAIGSKKKPHTTHIDASERGFIARAQWEGYR